MRKIFTFIACMFMGMFMEASAQTTVQEGNVIYELEGHEATVVNYVSMGFTESEVTIPSHVFGTYEVTAIGSGAFKNCLDLTKVTLPETLTKIDNGAFLRCSNLTEINIPSSVYYMGAVAFGACWSMPMENHILYADSYMIGVEDKYTGEISVREGTKFVGTNAFRMGQFYGSVLPNTLEYLCIGSFICCTLTDFAIPASVTTIDNDAFLISSIENLEVYWEDPSVLYYDGEVFDNCLTKKLTVPYGTKELYEADEHWNVFDEIVEREGDGIREPVGIVERNPQTYNLNGLPATDKGVTISNGKKYLR